MMLTSKKGISALQIKRVMGFGSYETALYMCNRIRAGLSEHKPDKLAGVVEVDETYIGGKDKNKHWDKRSGGPGDAGATKIKVIGAVSRKGKVVAKVLKRITSQTVLDFVHEAVSNKVSLLATLLARLRPLSRQIPARDCRSQRASIRCRRGSHEHD